MSEQIAIRIPDALAEDLEDLVARGRFGSKAEVVRTALQALVEAERRRRIGELIARGYERVPQEDDPDVRATAVRALHALEAEEEGSGLQW